MNESDAHDAEGCCLMSDSIVCPECGMSTMHEGKCCNPMCGPDASYIDKVATTLIQHSRTSIKGCHCGWAELGRSHAEHVAKVLDEKKLLVNSDHNKELSAKAWEEGFATGTSRAMRYMSDEPHLSLQVVNPYSN